MPPFSPPWYVSKVQAELPTLPRVGDTVDRYRVVLEVAHGGMAAVYAVQRTSIGGFEKLLAMKVMLPHLVGDEHFVNMFLDEARIASQIQHPNVVQVLDVGLHGRVPYLLMEYLRGQSLSRVLRRASELGRQLPLGFCLEVLEKAALGLHAAHETRDAEGKLLGVIHRDVSPHNIFVTYDGQVKVVDFGIAAARGRLVGTRSGEVKGKLAYLAPEQIDRSLPATRAVDVWAWGVVAWEAFSGRRLFNSKDEATALWNVLNAPIPKLEREMPRRMTQLIASALERRPGARPPDAKSVADTIAQIDAPRDIADTMSELFAEERVVEQERIASALRVGPPPPLKEPDSSTSPEPAAAQDATITHHGVTLGGGPRRRSRTLLLAGVAVAATAVGVSAWRLSTKSVEPATDEKAALLGADVVVHVDPRARFVLVDGTRHDERPVRIRLAAGASADVEVVGSDGEVVRRKVSGGDDGVSISLRAAPTAPSATTPPASSATNAEPRSAPAAAPPAAKPTTPPAKPSPASRPPKQDGTLLKNPF